MLIVITRLRLRDSEVRKKFLRAAGVVIRQATNTPGNLATEVMRDRNDVYWTRTAWSDRNSMVSFAEGEPHRGVMGSLDEWCDEATTVEWEQESPEFPDWAEISQRLMHDGRVSPLSQPSTDHVTRTFPPVTR